ncbi:uncharacterized protein [Nicotiana sylvestris]|uniref:uncharacterized protein n=1 Tax=Nicotiana sylvestris TaxID=4096 RepID=UPI00388C90AE
MSKRLDWGTKFWDVNRDLRELVVYVRRVNDRLLIIKLVVNGFTFNMISAYRFQAGWSEEVKRHFRKDLDEVVHGILQFEKIFIGGDFNGHVRETARGYDEVKGGFSFRHRLLVMDLEVKGARKKRVVYGQPKIKWGSLTKGKAQELGENLLAMRAWRSSRDASSMWTTTANCIREAAREVLEVSKGYSGGYNGDWWWNGEVRGKVKAKKVAYLKLV